MRAFVFLLAAGLAMPAAASADAQPRRWVTLGSITVGVGLDHGTIRIHNSGRHRQVRLCVSRNPVTINSFRVGFIRGGEQRIPVRRLVRPGECTLATTLHRAPQSIRTVWLNFVRLRRGARPIIRVQAR